jgi:hypothetical protein
MSMRVVVSTQGLCSSGLQQSHDPKPSSLRAHSSTVCIPCTLQLDYIASLRLSGMVGTPEKTYICKDVK